MLEATSFLRRLPATLNKEQKVRLDALVFSSDLLSYDLTALEVTLAKYGRTITDLTATDRHAVFLHAWSAVDQVHVICQLLRRLNEGRGRTINEFIHDFSAATRMRNRMDHLDANARNLSEQRGFRPPLFGAISYFHADKADIDAGAKLATGRSIVITAGTALNRLVPVPTPGTDEPVALSVANYLKLFAFDEELQLSMITGRLKPLLTKLEQDVEKQISDWADQLASSGSVSRDDLLRTEGGPMIMVLDMSFGTTSATPEPNSGGS